MPLNRLWTRRTREDKNITLPGAQSPPSSSCPPRSRPKWTEETFINSDEALAALSEDLSVFMQRHDITMHIPPRIQKFMYFASRGCTDFRAIVGFQDLFCHLDSERCPTLLRELIKAYFNDSPPLREHLSQSLQKHHYL